MNEQKLGKDVGEKCFSGQRNDSAEKQASLRNEQKGSVVGGK